MQWSFQNHLWLRLANSSSFIFKIHRKSIKRGLKQSGVTTVPLYSFTEGNKCKDAEDVSPSELALLAWLKFIKGIKDSYEEVEDQGDVLLLAS